MHGEFLLSTVPRFIESNSLYLKWQEDSRKLYLVVDHVWKLDGMRRSSEARAVQLNHLVA